MSREDADEFNAIIKHNYKEEVPEEPEDLTVTSIRELHEGLCVLGNTIMIVSDFISQYFRFNNGDTDIEAEPTLTESAIVYLKTALQNAELFNDTIMDHIFEDDDDDDEEDDEEEE